MFTFSVNDNVTVCVSWLVVENCSLIGPFYRGGRGFVFLRHAASCCRSGSGSGKSLSERLFNVTTTLVRFPPRILGKISTQTQPRGGLYALYFYVRCLFSAAASAVERVNLLLTLTRRVSVSGASSLCSSLVAGRCCVCVEPRTTLPSPGGGGGGGDKKKKKKNGAKRWWWGGG